MDRTQKADQVASIRDRFGRMVNAIVTDYRGLDVAAITELRKQFRLASVEFKVVKNTLVRRATADRAFGEALAKHLDDMTAIVWSYEDPSAAAKVIREFTRTNDKLKVKCGVMGDTVGSIEGWAELPSLPDLLAIIAAQMVAGPEAIVGQLVAPAQQIVSLLDAWGEKQDKDRGAAA